MLGFFISEQGRGFRWDLCPASPGVTYDSGQDVERFVVHQQKLILRLRRGRRVRTHPMSFFRPLRRQRPDAIANAIAS